MYTAIIETNVICVTNTVPWITMNLNIVIFGRWAVIKEPTWIVGLFVHGHVNIFQFDIRNTTFSGPINANAVFGLSHNI